MAPTSRTEAGSALMERRMKVAAAKPPNPEGQFLISSPGRHSHRGKALETLEAIPVIGKGRDAGSYPLKPRQRFVEGREMGSPEPHSPATTKTQNSPKSYRETFL